MQQTSWIKDILFLTILLSALFFISLGSRPLFVPDEGRYAEIAREMVASRDYVTPYLNSIKYFEKPVLFYWMEAAAIHLGGLNLWAIRSVNAVLGLLGCLLTYGAVRALYNRRTALLSACILGTSTLYFVMTHMISLDLPVTVFLSLTLYAFLLAIQHPAGNTRRFYLFGAALAAACAVLTKGLIGIVFPILIIGTFLAATREWRMLLKLYIPSCLLVFFLAAAPWHILVGLRHPEFFYFYFINQHFLRYTMLKIGHYQPVWFFIPVLIAGFFPWIVFLPQTLGNIMTGLLRPKNRTTLFLLIWAVLIFIFFSISKSKLIPYILPVFPPLAILTARYLDEHLNKPSAGIKAGFICLLPAALLITCVFFLFLQKAEIPDPGMATRYLYAAAAILMAGTLAACLWLSHHPKRSLVMLIASSGLFLLLAFSSLPFIDTRSILPLANILNPILKLQDEVVTYDQYFQDLPFYLERRVTILNWKNEMTQGMKHQDTREWMINDQTFWQRWHSEKRIFAIMGKKDYQEFALRFPHENHYLVGETINYVLICNQKLP